MRYLSFSLIALLTFAGSASADWSQWRGPDRTGKSTETGLLAEWPDEGPKLLWKVESVGEGFASYSIAGGKLLTQGQKDGQQYLFALDAETGEPVW